MLRKQGRRGPLGAAASLADRERTPLGQKVGFVLLATLACGYAWLASSFLEPTWVGGGGEIPVVVLGTMGAGTMAMTRELRALGLDVDHEATLGDDGVVGWIHALLYTPKLPRGESDPLCGGNLRAAWHVQLVAADRRAGCGSGSPKGLNSARVEACWDAVCPTALEDWRGCALEGQCPRGFTKRPIIMARHPLRTVESLVAGFCPRGDAAAAASRVRQLEAAGRLLLAPHLSRAALGRTNMTLDAAVGPRADWVRREDATACDVVALASRRADSPRLAAARRTCASDYPRLRSLFARLREKLLELRDDGAFGRQSQTNERNSLRRAPVAVTFDDLRGYDRRLADDVAKLAQRLGYADVGNPR
ncbi:hypothetical protein M885DRAFT_611269 [Pelagophyceae sp. CCMP2097]|nr:hypothetical protein M885DRAFT_611269 [Pelagophyceae sp. CCMP2097]